MMRTALGAFVALVLFAAGGCSQISQDLGDFMESFNPPSPGQAARWMFDPNDPDLRRKGLTLVAAAPFGGEEVYLRAYRDIVTNERDPIVRAIAVRALGRHGLPEDAPLVADLLVNDDNESVRWEAAKALQRLHNPEVIPSMLDRLVKLDESADVRAEIAIGLGQYPRDDVFQSLAAALDSPELIVNDAAKESLRTITGQGFSDDNTKWIAWYEQAEAAGDPFATRRPYVYPTYSRDIGWFEKLTFWSTPRFESPGPPAGLTPEGARSTYEEAGADDDGGPADGAASGARSTYGADDDG